MKKVDCLKSKLASCVPATFPAPLNFSHINCDLNSFDDFTSIQSDTKNFPNEKIFPEVIFQPSKVILGVFSP